MAGKKEEVKKEEVKVDETAKQVEEANKKIKKLEAEIAASKPKPTTEAQQTILTAKAQKMKEFLDKQKKETLFIPLDNKEQEGIKTITLNGYPFYIRKGAKVKVPAQVAEVYYDSIASQAQAVAEAQAKAGKGEGK